MTVPVIPTAPEAPDASAEATPAAASAEQIARAAALRRFNRLAVALPLTLTVLIAVLAFGALTWATLFAGDPTQRSTGRGIADLYLTVSCLLPLTLVCAIFPLGGVGLLYWRRQRGSLVRAPLQRLAGRADGGLATVGARAHDLQPKVAAPFIRARSWAAFAAALLRSLRETARNLFKRN